MRDLILKILKEEVKDGRVICDSCGWSWKLSESGKDKYICHECGKDNTPEKSNLDISIDKLSKSLHDTGMDYEIEYIKKFIKDYIVKNDFNVKFLESCTTGFAGVRTKNQIIICSPNQMSTLGDFIYTIFHEIRHEQQISKIKMKNPLSEMDLNDFEKLYKQYWEMELDADQFAKNKVTTLVSKLGIPPVLSKPIFGLSSYIEKYPSMSKSIENSIKGIIHHIKQMKNSGQEYTDIQDHPYVKQHLAKLKNFI